MTSVIAALMPWVYLWTVLFFGLEKGKMALVGCCLRGKMRGGERFWRLRRKPMVSYFQ
jgi:hypothetical protein